MSLRVRVLVEVGFTDGDLSWTWSPRCSTWCDLLLLEPCRHDRLGVARAVIDRMTSSSIHEASEQMKVLERNFHVWGAIDVLMQGEGVSRVADLCQRCSLDVLAYLSAQGRQAGQPGFRPAHESEEFRHEHH